MTRKANVYGGGARTNENGLHFEQTTSLNNALSEAGYKIRNKYEVYDGDTLVGLSVNKASFSNYFLDSYGIDYLEYNSKRWDPDEAFVNLHNQTVYIIEKKFQNSSGSVDEKLATFPFKIWEYSKLVNPIGFNVVYIYLLTSDWFDTEKYDDYYEYMDKWRCPHYFDNLPLDAIGL